MALFPKNDATTVAQQMLARFLQQPTRILHCTLLTGGSEEDKVVICFLPDTEYIIKLFHAQKAGANEIAWTKFASDLGIGPKFYHADADGRHMIIAVAQDAPLTPAVANRSEVIKNIAKSLAILHRADVPFGKKPDLFDRIDAKYAKLETSGALKEILEQAPQQVAVIKEKLLTKAIPLVPCHNDLNWGNIFVDGEHITFIDWGDAALGNPYYDIAAFLVLNVIDQRNEQFFFEQYDKQLLKQDRQEKMSLYKQLVHFEFALNLLLGVQALDKTLLHAKQLPLVKHISHYLTLLAKREVKIDGRFLYETAVASLYEMLNTK